MGTYAFIVQEVDSSLDSIKLLIATLRAVSFALNTMKDDDSRKGFIKQLSRSLENDVSTLNLRINNLNEKLVKHGLV